MKAGTLPGGFSAEADDSDELLRLSMGQLDDGADFVKLYLDGPDPDTPPWTTATHSATRLHSGESGRLPDRDPCDVDIDAVEVEN
jgi:hypothetical protein